MYHRAVRFAVAISLASVVVSQDLGDFLGGLSPSALKRGQEMSEKTNDNIKAANEATGSNITPLEDQSGFMRLFFTATPSVTPSPTPSVTPSSSPTPSVSPSSSPSPSSSASMTPASTPSVTPSKSPSPTPFQDGYPAFEVSTGTIKLSNDQNADPVQVTVSTNSGGRLAREGDIMTCDKFVVGGGFQGANAAPAVSRFSKLFPTKARFLLPGVVRENVPDESGERCGIKLTNTVDDSVTWIVPEADNGSCQTQSVPLNPISVPVTEVNGEVGCFFEIEAFCFSDDCPAAEIEFKCGFAGRSADETPAPIPSNN